MQRYQVLSYHCLFTNVVKVFLTQTVPQWLMLHLMGVCVSSRSLLPSTSHGQTSSFYMPKTIMVLYSHQCHNFHGFYQGGQVWYSVECIVLIEFYPLYQIQAKIVDLRNTGLHTTPARIHMAMLNNHHKRQLTAGVRSLFNVTSLIHNETAWQGSNSLWVEVATNYSWDYQCIGVPWQERS